MEVQESASDEATYADKCNTITTNMRFAKEVRELAATKNDTQTRPRTKL